MRTLLCSSVALIPSTIGTLLAARLKEASDILKTVKEEITKVIGVKEIRGVFERYDFVAIVETKTIQEPGTLVTSAVRNIKEAAGQRH